MVPSLTPPPIVADAVPSRPDLKQPAGATPIRELPAIGTGSAAASRRIEVLSSIR